MELRCRQVHPVHPAGLERPRHVTVVQIIGKVIEKLQEACLVLMLLSPKRTRTGRESSELLQYMMDCEKVLGKRCCFPAPKNPNSFVRLKAGWAKGAHRSCILGAGCAPPSVHTWLSHSCCDIKDVAHHLILVLHTVFLFIMGVETNSGLPSSWSSVSWT